MRNSLLGLMHLLLLLLPCGQALAELMGPPAEANKPAPFIQVHLEPVPFIASNIAGSIEMRVTDQIAIGIKGIYLNEVGLHPLQQTGFELGVTAPIYLQGEPFESGFLIRPTASYANWRTQYAAAGSYELFRTLYGDTLPYKNSATSGLSAWSYDVDSPVFEFLVGYQHRLGYLSAELGVGTRAFGRRFVSKPSTGNDYSGWVIGPVVFLGLGITL
jgi:hypothetical protein